VNDELLYEVADGIGRITFNRPEARNALTFRMYERLAEILREAENDSSVKVLILTGAGDKAFAAGTDISEFKAFSSPEDALGYEAKMDRILDVLERSRVPTIAAIGGACTGGGRAKRPLWRSDRPYLGELPVDNELREAHISHRCTACKRHHFHRTLDRRPRSPRHRVTQRSAP
jgi:hypothetical protein